MHPVLTSRNEEGASLDVLSWRLGEPLLVASTSVVGGGVGVRHWILNIQVPHDYERRDVTSHAHSIAQSLELHDQGVGLFTAASVNAVEHAHDAGVDVHATVGVRQPTWAASAQVVEEDPSAPGTINIVAFVPVRLSPGGLLNALTTITEAKSQALWDAGIAATGTASDAVCVACPIEGHEEMFAGPRSVWGSRLARGAHRAVLGGSKRAPS